MTDEPGDSNPVLPYDDNDYLGLPLTDRGLAWLHRRMISDERQLANILERYRQQENWDEERLAAFLETDLTGLYRLGLSGRPRATSVTPDVRAIAQANNIPDFPLLRLVRAVQTRDAFQRSPSVGRMLAAARDYDGEQPDATPMVGEEPATYDASAAPTGAAEEPGGPEIGGKPTDRDPSR